MKFYLTDQKSKFKRHLELLKTVRVADYNKSLLAEKITSIKIEEVKMFDQLNLGFLFEYDIFPDNIMAFKTQWADEQRTMKIGDTIVQQVYIPPVKTFSQKIIFGVRISEIINETNRRGFSYETLEGHVEKGISTFTVERQNDQTLFKIQTFSEPATFLTRLTAPLFAIPYQAFCTRAALRHVKRQLEKQ